MHCDLPLSLSCYLVLGLLPTVLDCFVVLLDLHATALSDRHDVADLFKDTHISPNLWLLALILSKALDSSICSSHHGMLLSLLWTFPYFALSLFLILNHVSNVAYISILLPTVIHQSTACATFRQLLKFWLAHNTITIILLIELQRLPYLYFC